MKLRIPNLLLYPIIFLQLVGCSDLNNASNPRGSATPASVTSQLVGYWINDASRSIVIRFTDTGEVSIYEPQTLSSTVLRKTLDFDFEVVEWTDQPCDCWLVTTPDASGHNQGSMGLVFSNNGHERFDVFEDSGGFYLGGEFVSTDSSLFTYTGPGIASLSPYGITLLD